MKKFAVILSAAALALCAMSVSAEETACEHAWTGWQTTSAATCTAAGTQINLCTKCGETQTQSIPATGHSFGEWQTAKAAGCTDGLQVRICSACGETESQSIPATGHSWTEFVTTKAATCTAEGQQTRLCTACGATESQSIPMADHSWSAWNVTKEANCAEAGSQIRICTACGSVDQETVPALGHKNVTIPGKAATCTATGLTDGAKCTVCGAVTKEQTVIPAAGHAYASVFGKAATCTETGLTDAYYCANCGIVEHAQTVIPAAGHSFTEWKVTKEATESVNGEMTSVCSVCGDTAVMEIPALVEVAAGETRVVADAALNTLTYKDAKSGTVDTITADNTSARYLFLSLEMIDQLKAEKIQKVVFVIGDSAVTVDLAIFDSEAVKAAVAGLNGSLAGYVIELDPEAAACALYAQTDALHVINGVDLRVTAA